MTLVSNAEPVVATVSSAQYDGVVVGAGPYGLSVAAHLLQRGLNVAVFGKPMNFWQEHMPRGMFLRSYWWATNLDAPKRQLGIQQFVKATSQSLPAPIPLQTFIDYGLWFQQQAVPNVDETFVTCIEREGGYFRLTLADGRQVTSLAVVMAVGLRHYEYRPEEYTGLPTELVSHTVEHTDFSPFAGKQVAVIGRGQSAVESAALLHEAGAEAHLITRGPIYWLPADGEKRTLWEKIRWPLNGISPGWKNWVLHHRPYLFYHVPEEPKRKRIEQSLWRAASAWLKERVTGKVVLHEGKQIQKVEVVDGQVELQLSSDQMVKVDHVLLATGYHVNVKRLPMLHPSLLDAVRVDEQNSPVLSSWFESSVSGLYFVGIAALWNFGPLYRFVCGTKAAAERVSRAATRYVAGERRRERVLQKRLRK